ncbi:MAG: methyl-accepting chemotaxis protein [Alteromonadales bacterium]|nr:methyl-accepting chemotaxis protein [Alteromonadales bacterium]
MKKLLQQFSIKAKIIASNFVLMLLMLVSSGYALYSMNLVDVELKSIAHQDIPLTKLSTKITEHQLEQAIHFERALRFAEIMKNDSHATEAFKENSHQFKELNHEAVIEIKEALSLTSTVISTTQDSEVLDEFKKIEQNLKQIELQHDQYELHAKEIFSAISNNGYTHAIEVMVEKAEHEGDELDKHLQDLLEEVEGFTEHALIKAEQHEHDATIMLAFILVIAVIVGSIFSWLVISAISKSMSEVSKNLHTISRGDLTEQINITGKDEVAKMQTSVKEMQQKFLDMLSTINQTSEQLSASAEQTSQIASDTREHIYTQQSQTEMVASAMTEMNATVQDISKSIAETASATDDANNETRVGSERVEETSGAIKELAIDIVSSSEIINSVKNESNTIGSVLDVIKSIAEQTNLLALNAAIEAARAGEQGRGFAVVADEVRTLASRTQDATEEINQMIERLQVGSQSAVSAMTRSSEQAEVVVEKAGFAGESIQSISTAVNQINEMATQIATAAEEQGAVSEEISSNIESINEIANQTASNSEQIATSSSALSGMADKLQGLLAQFKIK